MGPGQSCRREGFYQGIEARSVHEGLRAHTGGADGRRTPLRPGPPNAGLRPDAPGPPSRRGRSWTLTAPDAELSEVNLTFAHRGARLGSPQTALRPAP